MTCARRIFRMELIVEIFLTKTEQLIASFLIPLICTHREERRMRRIPQWKCTTETTERGI